VLIRQRHAQPRRIPANHSAAQTPHPHPYPPHRSPQNPRSTYEPALSQRHWALNRRRLGRLRYVMERSLTKTLACKYRISVRQVKRRYRAVLQTEHGPRRGLRVTVDRGTGRRPLVAQWGGISLARKTTATVLNDSPARIWSTSRSELVQRLLADQCEQCGSRERVEVHHVRALKDLKPKGRKPPPEWATRMAARHRKTLVVCRACHEDIHAGRPTRQKP